MCGWWTGGGNNFRADELGSGTINFGSATMSNFRLPGRFVLKDTPGMLPREFHFNLTESSVNFGIILSQDDQKILDTTFQGYIIPLTTRNLLKCVHRVLTTVLMTEFRILRQAYSLFFKKRIRFFTNPHPRKIGSGTRSRGFISKLKLPFK